MREIDHETDDVGRQSELAASADGPTGLVTSLQDERNWAAVDSIGQADQVTLAVEGYRETRRRTDEALARFGRLLARSEDETRRAFAPAVDGLAAELERLRDRIDDDPAPHTLLNVELGNEIFDRYASLIAPFLTGTTEVAVAVDDADLRQGAELIDVAARQIETTASLARAVTITSALTDGGIDRPQELASVSALLADVQRNAEVLRLLTTGLYAGTAGDELFVDFTDALTDQVNAAMEGHFDVAEMLQVINLAPEDSYDGYRHRVADIVRAKAGDLKAAALRRERTLLALLAAAVVVALAIVIAVSRSITRPLQALTSQTVELAHHGLPHAVGLVLQTPLGEDVTVPQLAASEIRASGEVTEVAAAFDAVRLSALELAAGQALLRRNVADTFGSLGRRNQGLLRRQLLFITELERRETDPDVLAQLFQLDHLATRMRRNAESLLVLAGSPTPRQWATPVPITDVVRAAVGEVEHYQRVVVRAVEPVTIRGNIAADLAHLLAELIENALVFSPLDEAVEVRGMTLLAGYTLAVVDSGLGMTTEEIARANRRLTASESFTVAPSKYLGHYVAGNLAVRHGIGLRLHPSAGSGIIATVHLPRAILSAGEHVRV